jgi:hypothetical protein
MINMNRNVLAVMSAILLFGTTGCQTYRPNATAGGLLGGTAGGLMGAAIGSNEGKSKEGAMIGALAGGLTGAVIGNQADEANFQQQQFENENAIRARRNAVTLDEVIQMSQSGLNEVVIINQIKTGGVAKRPTTNDLILLKTSGVSDSVIRELQTAGTPIALANGPPNYYPPHQAIYVDRLYVPICPAPPIIYRPVPYRHSPRHAGHSRAGFTFQF